MGWGRVPGKQSPETSVPSELPQELPTRFAHLLSAFSVLVIYGLQEAFRAFSAAIYVMDTLLWLPHPSISSRKESGCEPLPSPPSKPHRGTAARCPLHPASGSMCESSGAPPWSSPRLRNPEPSCRSSAPPGPRPHPVTPRLGGAPLLRAMPHSSALRGPARTYALRPHLKLGRTPPGLRATSQARPSGGPQRYLSRCVRGGSPRALAPQPASVPATVAHAPL